MNNYLRTGFVLYGVAHLFTFMEQPTALRGCALASAIVAMFCIKRGHGLPWFR